MKNVIELKDFSCYYEKEKPVLRGIALTIAEGESVVFIGANGSGKSSLLGALCGLVPCEGEISVCSLPLTKANLPEIRKNLGYMLQDSDNQLFLPTVYDDIAFAPRNYGLSEEEVEKLVDEALNRSGIEELKYRQNYKLSGGEKRMVCTAVVLAMKPSLLLLDEPSITLDPWHRRRLIEHLNQMPETKLIASHDLDMILETCDRVIILDNGSIKADGPAEVILHDKELLESCRLELPYCFQQPVPYQK